MEFDSVIKKRRSVRSFTSKKPSFKQILEAIDATLKNPFAGNHNNVKFVIIEDENTIKEITKHTHQSWIENSSLIVLICSNDTHLENLYGERGRVYSRQQAGAVVQTFLLKLVDLGLSACWVGAYTDEIIKQLLKIPQNIQIEAIIPVGHEKKGKTEKKPKKQDLENVLFWEQWAQTKRPPIFQEPKDNLSLDGI